MATNEDNVVKSPTFSQSFCFLPAPLLYLHAQSRKKNKNPAPVAVRERGLLDSWLQMHFCFKVKYLKKREREREKSFSPNFVPLNQPSNP